MKKSAAIIVEQAARIAELERGLGDIFMMILESKNGKEHNFIKNGDSMVNAISGQLREILKTDKNAESTIRPAADSAGQGTEVEN